MRTGHRRRAPAAPSAPGRWRLLLIVAVICGVYANTFAGPFIFDDIGTLVENPRITSGWSWDGAFGPSPDTALAGRPLAHLSFAINYALSGLDVTGYHAFNLAVHVLAALLTYGIVRRTIERTGPSPFGPVRGADVACAAAILWGVHPLASEPVNYLTQRTESLMAMFFMLTLYANARSHGSRHSGRWQAAAIAACLAGAGCKETIAVAPLAVLLYDRVFVFESLRNAFRHRWRLYASLTLVWLAVAALLAYEGQSAAAGFESASGSVWTYFLNQPRMILRYLRLAVWPDSLVLYYGWTPAARLTDMWPYIAAVTLLFGGAIFALWRHPALGFLAALVFLTLGPTSSFVPIATEVGAERRMYLAMTAIATITAIGLARLSMGAARRVRPATAFAGLVALLAIPLSVVTHARTREYSSALVMAGTVLARWPTANAEYMVGTELAATGRRDQAIAHLQTAARGYPPANYPLGALLMDAGRNGEGITALREFIRVEPTALASRRAHGLLANAFADQGRFRDAIPHYREYLAAYPLDADAWNAVGVAFIRENQLDDAVSAFRAAVRARPGDSRLTTNLERAEALRRDPYK